MGDDLVLPVTGDETVVEILEVVQELMFTYKHPNAKN